MTATVEVAVAGSPDGWVGRPPAPLEIAAILFVGSVGILIAGLQPQLLGALALEHRIGDVELGQAATAELLTIGVAAGLAGAILKPTGLRWWGAGAALALAVIDFLVGGQSHLGVILNRAVAGLAEGIMLWIPVSMIARSLTPGRWSGIFLAAQTLAQLGLSAVLPYFVIAKYGASGGFDALAIASIMAAIVAFLMPREFLNLPKAEEGVHARGAASPRAIAVLASVFLFMAFIVGLWAYFEPLSAQAGHAPHVYEIAVSVSLAAQVVGAFAASFIAGRVPYFPIVVTCTILDLAILALLAAMPGAGTFIALAGLFGFLWLFLMPFQVPMVIDADPSRRAAVLMPGAQLLGSALGPLLCSFAITQNDVRGGLAVCAAMLALGFGVAAWLHYRH